MSIASLDATTQETLINSLETALSAAGVLTTTHFKSTTSLIVTTTRSAKLLRITAPAVGRMAYYYGDSWSSGDAVTNQITVNYYNSGGSTDHKLVVSDTILLFGWRSSASVACYMLVGNLDNLTSDNIIWGWSCGLAGGLLRHIPTSAQMNATMYDKSMQLDGKYLMADVPCLSNADVLLAPGIKGFKALYKGQVVDPLVMVNGNDAVVAGGGLTGFTNNYFPKSFIAINGNSWTPP